MESYWKAWAWPCSRRGGSGGAKQVLCVERPLRGGSVREVVLLYGEQRMLGAVLSSEEGREDGAKIEARGRGETGGRRVDGLANRHGCADKWISLAPLSALGNSKNTTHQSKNNSNPGVVAKLQQNQSVTATT